MPKGWLCADLGGQKDGALRGWQAQLRDLGAAGLQCDLGTAGHPGVDRSEVVLDQGLQAVTNQVLDGAHTPPFRA